MKYLVVLLLTVCLQPVMAINVTMNYGVFQTPDRNTYFETYALIDAVALTFVDLGDSNFQAAVEMTIIFERDGAVANYSKVIVKSPITHDPIHALTDFIDLQRFSLNPGTYAMSIRVADVNNPTDTTTIEHVLLIDEHHGEPWFSSVMVVDEVRDPAPSSVYNRSNKELIPRVSAVYPSEVGELTFYTELYDLPEKDGEATDYLVTLDLIDTRTDEVLSNYHVNRRVRSGAVTPILHRYDISELPGGQYVLRLETRDRTNALLCKQNIAVRRIRFVQDSPEAVASIASAFPLDSLREMTYCLRYIATPNEEAYIEENWKSGDSASLGSFFYYFWKERNAVDPAAEWNRYHQSVSYVEKNFTTNMRHGCATDRGRVYLKYGKPNSLSDVPNEPAAYPYQIWHYYKADVKNHARFVFYAPTGLRDDYTLLHSNVPGEMYTTNWYTRLSYPQGSHSGNDELIDQNLNNSNAQDVGFRALEYWNNPR